MAFYRTAILMAGMTALVMGLGSLLGGTAGALIALAVASAMNLFTDRNSDTAALRIHGTR